MLSGLGFHETMTVRDTPETDISQSKTDISQFGIPPLQHRAVHPWFPLGYSGTPGVNGVSHRGVTQVPMERKTKHMSGGWRMRVSLAQALFAMP